MNAPKTEKLKTHQLAQERSSGRGGYIGIDRLSVEAHEANERVANNRPLNPV